jgi:phage terminase large subunit-like protein
VKTAKKPANGKRPLTPTLSPEGARGKRAAAEKGARGKKHPLASLEGGTRKRKGLKAAALPGRLVELGRRLRRGKRGAFEAGAVRAVKEGWSTWIRGYQDALAVADGCWFDADEAALAIAFFEEFLVHTKGQIRGKPFVLLGWQREEIVAPLFGWKRADGTRRFRRAFIFLPKKNGKSTLSAGIALALLCHDQEAGAEVYFAATKIDQARIVFKTAKAMVNGSPALREALKVQDHLNQILYPAEDGEMRVLAADGPSAEGLNIHGLIRDELHAWRDDEFYASLQYGGVGRAQPLFVDITTSGDWQSTICRASYDHAAAVRDGAVDDWELLPVIYEAGKLGEGDGWKRREAWVAANPGFGELLREEDFASNVRDCEGKPNEIAKFKRYRLNMWQESTEPWIPLSTWLACADEGMAAPWSSFANATDN